MPNFPTALRLWISIVLPLLCAGCPGSIYRESKIGDDRLVITDAEQRAILFSNVDEDPDQIGRLKPKKVVCAEPSPDVAKALSSSLAASIESALKQAPISASLGLSTVESIAQLGERIATIQLLRDELADLCRSYANGAVSATTYTLRLSRLDKKMVTLLISESAAGAFGRTLASLTGTASSSAVPRGGAEEVEKLRGEVAQAEKELAAAEDALKKAPDADKPKKEEERKAASAKLDQKRAALAAAERLFAIASASGEAGAAIGTIENRATATSAQFERIQGQFLEDDDLGTILDACISTLDIRARETKEPDEAKLSQLQNSLTDARKRAYAAELEMKRKQTERQITQKALDDLGKQTDPVARAGIPEAKLRIGNLDREIGQLEVQGNEAYDQFRTIEKTLDAIQEPQKKISRFAEFCELQGIGAVLETMRQGYNAQERISANRMQEARAAERAGAWEACAPILKGTAPNPGKEISAYCRALFAEAP
jgi:predicted  nucleic acid-binding Zn-ribbon protein